MPYVMAHNLSRQNRTHFGLGGMYVDDVIYRWPVDGYFDKWTEDFWEFERHILDWFHLHCQRERLSPTFDQRELEGKHDRRAYQFGWHFLRRRGVRVHQAPNKNISFFGVLVWNLLDTSQAKKVWPSVYFNWRSELSLLKKAFLSPSPFWWK